MPHGSSSALEEVVYHVHYRRTFEETSQPDDDADRGRALIGAGGPLESVSVRILEDTTVRPAEVAHVAEAIDKTFDGTRALADSASTTDAAGTLKRASEVLVDVARATDRAARDGRLSRVLADAARTVDAATRVGDISLSFGDTATSTDSVTRTGDLTRVLPERLNNIDAIGRVGGLVLKARETASAVDVVTRGRPFVGPGGPLESVRVEVPYRKRRFSEVPEAIDVAIRGFDARGPGGPLEAVVVIKSATVSQGELAEVADAFGRGLDATRAFTERVTPTETIHRLGGLFIRGIETVTPRDSLATPTFYSRLFGERSSPADRAKAARAISRVLAEESAMAVDTLVYSTIPEYAEQVSEKLQEWAHLIDQYRPGGG